MRLKIALSLLTILSVQITHSIIEPVLQFMRSRVYDMRCHTFEKALHLMEQRNVKVIVETGTARGGHLAFDGDGGFTIIFGYWSSLNKADLYSVDILEQALINARTMLTDYLEHVHLIHDDSVNYLKNFDKTIDFLYLDSFDFDKSNPEPSQLHHLREIEVAYEKLSPDAIVMIDDCGLPHGGKGKFVIEYLKKKGWKIYAQSYQVIMVRS